MTESPAHAFFRDELDRLERAFAAGHFPALVEALLLCAANGLPTPAWVGEHGASALMSAFNGEALRGTRTGRAGGLSAQAENCQLHFTRWFWARFWLDHRAQLRGTAFKPTREGVFALVSAELRQARSFARGEPAAIAASFKKIELAIKAGTAAPYFAGEGEVPPSPKKTARVFAPRAKKR